MKRWQFALCVAAIVLSLVALYFVCAFFYRQLIMFALFIVFLALAATTY